MMEVLELQVALFSRLLVFERTDSISPSRLRERHILLHIYFTPAECLLLTPRRRSIISGHFRYFSLMMMLFDYRLACF